MARLVSCVCGSRHVILFITQELTSGNGLNQSNIILASSQYGVMLTSIPVIYLTLVMYNGLDNCFLGILAVISPTPATETNYESP